MVAQMTRKFMNGPMIHEQGEGLLMLANLLYSWGNNTDGQCGQGQKCPDHRLIYVDPHMHRTAMQAITEPRLVSKFRTGEDQVVDDIKFRFISSGGYHVLGVDIQNRLWTWGQGLWGKLGHGDQKSAYEPRLVDALKHHICQTPAAGTAHSACLCAMYRLTVSGRSTSVASSPVSYLGMPAGRVDRYWGQQKTIKPPNTKLEIQAFASAPMLEVGLPFNYTPNHAFFDPKAE